MSFSIITKHFYACGSDWYRYGITSSTRVYIIVFQVLYLQADNSGKDNKNKYMLAFLNELIERQVFESIEYSFLMVGHTHTDIDQVRTSSKL